MSNAYGAARNLRSNDFTFLNRREYFSDLTQRIENARKGDRILLVTHDFHPDEPQIAELMAALVAAAQRGVNTHFALDERSFPLMQRVPINKKSERLIQATHNSLRKLRAAGATYAITNKSFHRLIHRFSGRAHIKSAIINDLVYVGGCNLTRTNQIDIMVRWRDSRTADWLYSLLTSMIHAESSQQAFAGKDFELAIDADTKLLLDAGTPKQSLIYEHALQLIDDAKEWLVLTCQYFPNSITGRHLVAAYKRGVHISVYYNHPSIHQPGFNTLVQGVVLRERFRYPRALFAEQLHKFVPYVHAKILANEKTAMIGSHNYMTIGVTFGTAELTLVRHDPAFARKVIEHFRRQLVPYMDSRQLTDLQPSTNRMVNSDYYMGNK